MYHAPTLKQQLEAQINFISHQDNLQSTRIVKQVLLRQALSLAALLGDSSQVIVLMQQLPILLVPDCTEYSALYHAFDNGHKAIAIQLLQKAVKCQENFVDEFQTALCELNSDYFDFLLAHGAYLPDKDNCTPLERALQRGKLDLAYLLGLRLAKTYIYHHTSLHRAVLANQPSYVQLLLEQGADVNALTQQTQQTPLALAAQHGYLPLVKILCQHSAIKLNRADPTGATPIVHAIIHGHTAIAQYLLLQPTLDVSMSFTWQGSSYTLASYLIAHYSPQTLHHQALFPLLQHMKPLNPVKIFERWLSFLNAKQQFPASEQAELQHILLDLPQALGRWIGSPTFNQSAYQELLRKMELACYVTQNLIQRKLIRTVKQQLLIAYDLAANAQALESLAIRANLR